MAGAEEVKTTSQRVASAGQKSTEALHQGSKLPQCPLKMAIGGFAIAVTLGYLTLYSKKKPEASALDVAKVTSGASHPDNTHPLRK